MNPEPALDFSAWANAPWFLEEEDDVFSAMGFRLQARRSAAVNLARVFTPEVCREIQADPKRGYGMAAFLALRWWPGMLIPLLEVGRDLGVVEPWGDEKLLKRLTRRNEFHDAAFELRVLANLRLAGYRAERVPEAPPRRTPDLRLRLGLDDYELELKGVSDSPLDEVTDLVDEALSHANLIVPGLHLELRGSGKLEALAYEEPQCLVAEIPALVAAFEATVAQIRGDGAKPGTYGAAPFGTVLATPANTLGSMTPAVVPDLPPEKRVNKLVRLVRRAASQFTVRRGVAVLGVRRSADMMAVDAAVRAAARVEPSAFGRCHMVVLVDSVRDGVRDYSAIPLARAVQVHERRQLSKAQEKLARVAAGRAGQLANPVRPALPGEPGFNLGTVRRAVTTAVIGPNGKVDVGGLLPGTRR